MQWLLERDGPGFNFSIANVCEWGPPTVKLGWGRRSIEFQRLHREDAEQSGMLKDGKWLAFHRDGQSKAGYHPWRRWGVAMGRRMWTVELAGVDNSAGAVALREADEEARRSQRDADLKEWGVAVEKDGEPIGEFAKDCLHRVESLKRQRASI